MTNQLYISILFCFVNFSTLHSQNSDVKINKEYQRIEHLKTLMIDSLTHLRGIDFNRGNNVDEKKFKIFKEKKKIIKIEYEEIGNGYREWNKKTIIYLNNDIPFFIKENTNGIMTLFVLEGGEKSEPYSETEEIYIYDWNSEKTKRIFNGHDVTLKMKVCKICYDELIEKIKLEFISKP